MTKFSDLKLDPKVLQAIAEAGYESPTPIQAGAIPPALEGRDVLGIAQTGTGKTAGFVLPMITLLGRGRARARMPRSLVLCPTRELAAQVAENFDTYAKHTRLTKALLIGGVSMRDQEMLIGRGVDVLIATPGRLLDHFERGNLLLQGVQIMVVDEADRMLDMGFIPDIERIFQLTPFTRQTLFFSATMAPEIERITNTFLHAPERVEVARQATTSETITQRLVEITPTRKDQTAKQKRELLRALIDAEGEALKNAIIFCNRKTEVDIVAKSLKAYGYDAAPLHGDLDQSQRTRTLDGFRDGTLRFLVASDVAARGLDIPAVSHVFNFDLPSHAEDYVHRIGRTGRAGRLGTAYSLGTPSDEKYLTAIEALVKQALPRTPVPEGFTLSEAAQSAPRPVSERGGRGTKAGARGPTGRTRGRKDDRDEPRSGVPVPVTPAPAQAPQERPRDEARAERHDDRPRDETRADRRDERAQARPPREERTQTGERPRNGERGEQGDRDVRTERRDDRRDRYRDRGPSVPGLGDHVPDFMLTSFHESLAVTEARMSAPRTEDAPADEPALPAPASASAPAKTRASKPRRGRKSARDTAPVAADSAMGEEAPTSAAEADAPAMPAEVAQTPAGTDLPGDNAVAPSQDAATDAAPLADAPLDGTAPDAAPSAETAEPAATEPARPTRRRSRAKPKAAATTDADAATDGDVPAETALPVETAAPPAKPRRTRTRKTAVKDAPLPEEREAEATVPVSPEPDLPPVAPAPPADALPEEREAADPDGTRDATGDGAEAPAPEPDLGTGEADGGERDHG